MRKIKLMGLMLILSLGLLACNTSDGNIEEPNDDVPMGKEKEDDENDQDELDSKDDVKDSGAVVINTGSTETVNRVIEGMDEEVEVVNYQIEPYDISYQLDETFGKPEVKDNEIIYTNDEYKIILEIIQHINLEEAVSNLQKRYEIEEYEQVSELENTSHEENELNGKMQYFDYPDMQGFYIYEIDEHALAISYKYPVEAADGMGSLLKALRKSIQVK